MKEFLIFLPLTVLYLAFKSALLPGFPLPDIPLIIIFYMASRKASIEGVLLAFSVGYVEDTLNGWIIGSTSFSMVFIFLTAHLLSKKVHFSTPSMRAGGAAFFTLMKGALLYIITRFVNYDVPFLLRIIFQAVVTGIFAPAIITLLSRISAWTGPGSFKGSEN